MKADNQSDQPRSRPPLSDDEPHQGVRQEEVDEGQDEEPAFHSKGSCSAFSFSVGALAKGALPQGMSGFLPLSLHLGRSAI